MCAVAECEEYTKCHHHKKYSTVYNAFCRSGQSWPRVIFYSTLHELRSFTDSSHSFTNASRVDSFVFFSFAKYETIRNRSLFRRVSIVSRNMKYSVSSCFSKLKKRFVSFRTFYLSFVPFLEFHRYVTFLTYPWR